MNSLKMKKFAHNCHVVSSITVLFVAVCISLSVGDKYPLLNSIPETNFTCWQKTPGYYADPGNITQCQVYHMCQAGGRMFSYLCPNHTLFDQDRLICEHWYKVNCTDIENRYKINDEIFTESMAKIPKKKPNLIITRDPKPVKPDINSPENNGNPNSLLFSRRVLVTTVTALPITTPNIIPKISINRTVSVNSRPRYVEISRRRSRISSSNPESLFLRLTTTTAPVIIKTDSISQPRRGIFVEEEPDFKRGNSVADSVPHECEGCLEYFMKDKNNCTPCILPR